MSPWDRLVLALVRRSGPTLAAGAVLFAACAAFAPGVAFTSDATEHLPRVTPAVAAWLELSRRFDAFNSLIIGLEEPAAPLTTDGLSRVKRITDRLAALKASGVLAVSSVTNVDSIREAEDGSLETELLIPQVPSTPEALKALAGRIAGDVQVSGALISRDQRGYLILVRADPRKDTAALAQALEKVVEAERGPMQAAYFGAPFISAEITRGVYAKLRWLVPAFVLLLLGVLAVAVRRAAVVALVLASVALSLLVWLGLVRALGVVLTFTSLTALLVLAVVGAVAFARGLELRAVAKEAEANPFPGRVLAGLAALGLAALALRWQPIGFLAAFGVTMALGSLAVAAVGLLFFAPLAARVSAWAPGQTPPARPVALGLALAVGVVAVAGAVATRAQFHATPQSIFSADGAVGRSLAFFDRRFGGPDFLQIDYRGDLRDPGVAARLLRLSDLLEGTEGVADVRSVAQILGFLNKGFGGVHRVPPTRESLGNLWFFLEGRSDVRNLASDARDEAMAVIRVPSRPTQPISALVERVERAVPQSLELGPAGARLRLHALAAAFKVAPAPGKVDEVLAAATAVAPEAERAELTAQVNERLRKWLGSDDSPYQPTDEEWTSLQGALAAPPAERAAKLGEVTRSFSGLKDEAMAQQLVDTVLAREKDLELNLRTQSLADRLWGPGAPEALRVRAQGVLVDLLDPPPHAGESAQITVTGLPVVAAQLEHGLLVGLWRALGLLVLLGPLLLLALTRKPALAARALVEAAVATAATMALAGALGLGADSGSASLFLLPPVVALISANGVGSGRLTTAFIASLAAASLALLFVGVEPVSRIGSTVAIGLGAVAAVNALSRRFRRAGLP